MSYIKFKSIAPKFNFFNTLEKDNLPKYVLDHLDIKEEVFEAFRTFRDKAVFTDRKLILFDRKLSGKQIYILPYDSFSSISIDYAFSVCTFYIHLINGDHLELRFLNQTADNKKRLREVFAFVGNKMSKQ